MSWHASAVVRSLGIALSVAAAASDCAQQALHLPPPIVLTLPPSGSSTAPAPPRPPPEAGSYGPSRADSIAVYTAALRTVEREALGREPLGLLLLQRFMPPDTSLEHELLRRRVIAGICEAANPFGNTCSNGVRGLTASFEIGKPFIFFDQAFASVRVRPMQAEGDHTWLVEPWGHSWVVRLTRRDSTWVAAVK